MYELKIGYAYNTQGNPTYKKYMDARLSDKELARETFSWNNRDQLTSIRGRVTEDYVYDYEGLRLQRTATKPGTPNNTVSTYVYTYLQNNQPAFKYNVSENTFDVFVYEGSKRIMRVRVNSMGTATKEYFINDYQGSPVAVVDDSQNIKYQNYNDPFGNMEMSIGVPSSNPEFKYTDKELDEDSGLYYFQARYYDPLGGRFPNRDQVKLENNTKEYFQINSYQFCNNNPVRNVDPDGRLKTSLLLSESLTVGFYNTTAERPLVSLDSNSLSKPIFDSDWDVNNSYSTDLAEVSGQLSLGFSRSSPAPADTQRSSGSFGFFKFFGFGYSFANSSRGLESVSGGFYGGAGVGLPGCSAAMDTNNDFKGLGNGVMDSMNSFVEPSFNQGQNITVNP